MKKLLLIITGILIGFSVFAQPSNDYIGNALIMNSCGGIFSASNAGATDAYSSSQAGCGTYQNNFDCNNSTGNNGSGTEVSYTIENDIWYYFCPGVNGTWTITVDQVSCSTNNGYQIWVGQGTPTNLHTEFYENGCGNPGCASGVKGGLTFDINVTDYTQGCVYIGVDGYAGTTCTFQISINTTTCTLLADEILQIDGERVNEKNKINWFVGEEQNTNSYSVLRSTDNFSWSEIYRINANSSNTYSYLDDVGSGLYYYKIVNKNSWNQQIESRVIALNGTDVKVVKKRVFDVFGKEYFENNLPIGGIIIYMLEYANGEIVVRKEYK